MAASFSHCYSKGRKISWCISWHSCVCLGEGGTTTAHNASGGVQNNNTGNDFGVTGSNAVGNEASGEEGGNDAGNNASVEDSCDYDNDEAEGSRKR